MSSDNKSRENIEYQDQWAKVARELEEENEKLQVYDKVIIECLGDVNGKKILDYGAGPAVIATFLKSKGANVKVYDLNEEMREIALKKLDRASVFDTPESVPNDFFDIILCNLVLCIVDEEEAKRISQILETKMNSDGKVYIGFCNPKIFDCRESKLDYRFPTGENYSVNHDYKKVKKEGNYQIVEKHRPIEWYRSLFKEVGFEITQEIFTPEYELNSTKIQDFIIFELKR